MVVINPAFTFDVQDMGEMPSNSKINTSNMIKTESEQVISLVAEVLKAWGAGVSLAAVWEAQGSVW